MKRICLKLLLVWLGLTGAYAFAQTSNLPARNVIWVVADGMGPELAGLLMQGARAGVLPAYAHKSTALEQLLQTGTQGVYFNHTQQTVVTDSAASATQMATGQWSLPGRIGIDFEGNSVPNLLELARQNGKAIGVISDTYVTDATPAGFTGHTLSRRDKYTIARQQLALAPEVLLGGGKKYFSTKENKNLLNAARKQGYQVVENKKALKNVKKGNVLGLFAPEAMPMAVEMHAHGNVPALSDMTRQALEILSQDPDGFILMVEAGKIDWAAHANDAGATLAELKALDDTLAVVYAYAQQHPDTLVYLNADHDTGLGAFAYRVLDKQQAAQKTEQGETLYEGHISYVSFEVYAKLDKQRQSLYRLAQELKKLPPEQLTASFVQQRLSQAAGYPVEITGVDNWQDVDGVLKQLNEQYGLKWATQTHSSAMLLGVAYGPYQELFRGVYHNTDILAKLKIALGWSEKEYDANARGR